MTTPSALAGEAWLDGLFTDMPEFDTDSGSGCASGNSSGAEDDLDPLGALHHLDLGVLPELPCPLTAAHGDCAPEVFPAGDDLLSLLETGCAAAPRPQMPTPVLQSKRRGGSSATTPRACKRRSPESLSSADSVASDRSSSDASSASSSAFASSSAASSSAASSVAVSSRTSASPLWNPAAAPAFHSGCSARAAPSASASAASTSASASSASSFAGLDTAEARRLKREHKKARNRQLAAESRERKKHRVDALELENRDLRVRVRDLEATVRSQQQQLTQQQQQLTQQQQLVLAGDMEDADDDAENQQSLRPSFDPTNERELSLDRRGARRVGAAHSTKLGTAAMALAMSLVVMTDSSGGLRGGIAAGSGGSSAGGAGSFELIGIWALGLDLLSGSGLALDLLLPHVVALSFGTTLTFAFVAAYYFRVLSAKRPLLAMPVMSMRPALDALRPLAASVAHVTHKHKSNV